MKMPSDSPNVLSDSDAWFAIIGARIYANVTDTNPVQIPEFNTTWLFYEPDASEINDPELEALFEDIEYEDIDYLEDDIEALLKELNVQMKVLEELLEETAYDAADNSYADSAVAALYTDSKASQSINTAYKVVPEVTLPDQLDFIFKADIPIIALTEGSVIYQFLELTEGSDTIAVECKVSVGNPDGVVSNVFSAGGLDKSTANN
jgi:hypothetical protein